MPKIVETHINNIRFEVKVFETEKTYKNNAMIFCLHGGGSSRGYFNLTPHLSFAKIMNDAGYDVLTMDHPGIGTNPLPADHPFLTPKLASDYIAQTLSHIVDASPIICVAHSMGGVLATMAQSRHNIFSALVLMGSNARGLDWGLSEAELRYKDQANAVNRDLETLTLSKFKAPFPPPFGAGPRGKSITFGGETPELTQALRDNTAPLFAAGGIMSMIKGSFIQDVENLCLPVFLISGDHDIGVTPEEAKGDYINAHSVEILVLDKTGHNHTAFKSIKLACMEIDQWIQKTTRVSNL